MKFTDTLSRLPDKQAGRGSQRLPKKRLLLTAAAVLIASAASISAATYIKWSRGLEERLQVPEERRQELEDSKMASFVGQPVTQGGITVTAQQSIVDSYFAYLSFKVEGYQAADGLQPDFSDVSIAVGGDSEYTGGWSAGFFDGGIPGEDGKAVYADNTSFAEGGESGYIMEDGSMEYHVLMMGDEKGYFLNKPIHVELKDLGTYKEKAGDVVVDAEGDWNFDWMLQGSDQMEKFELDTPLGHSGATVLDAELSPISVFVTYEFPRQEEGENIIDENGNEVTRTMYKDAPPFTGVRMKDGTVYTGLSGGGILGYAGKDTDIYEYTAALNRVIDVGQVECLLFIRSYPEDGQPFTEENLYFVPVD